MSVRALAERVLFSSSLEDKLRAPEALVDDGVGAAPVEPPRAPARPAALAFGASRPRVAFPGGTRDLESDRARGVALHFFANHELLAMELMAVVLLAFPNAPRRFRWGVVHTLIEEQDHLRKYVQRMGELDVALGDVPVSDFFWRCLSNMQSPLDFVAGMSLTFEQANIDFARYYAERFREVGDAPTADLLDRVLADEIRHVAHGRVWLERWAPPAESLFARHRAALPGPLTLRRARGPVYCASERRAAGLPDGYIDELRVYSDSRGRRPDLWVFNPGAEEALAGGGLSAAAKAVRDDLAPLLGFLAAPEDRVRVARVPSIGHRSALADAGFEPPHFVPDDGSIETIERVRPWAATEDARAQLPTDLDLRAPYAPGPSAPFSKRWDLEIDASLPAEVAGPFEPRPTPRCWVTERVELAPLVRRAAPLRLKAGFGTSGRGQRVLPGVDALSAAATWVEARLREGGLVAEVELDVRFELSILLDLDQRRPVRAILEAWSDAGGRYVGHRLTSPWARLPRALLRAAGGGRALRQSLERVGEHVAERLREAGCTGLAGVDSRVYAADDGGLRVQPIGEVNPRCTMGHIAQSMARRLPAHRDGVHVIVPRRVLGEPVSPPTLRTPSGTGFTYTTDPAQSRQLVGLLSVVETGQPPAETLPAPVRAWLDARLFSGPS